MAKFEKSTTIQAPVETVYAYVQEPENLLEAFRAYQKRSRASAGRSF